MNIDDELEFNPLDLLSKEEIESLHEHFNLAFSAHLRWLGRVNKSLLFMSSDSHEFCASATPYHDCEFGQWFDNAMSQELLQHRVVKEVGHYHRQIHIEVCALFDEARQTGTISAARYQTFLDTQNAFFARLLKLSVMISKRFNFYF